MRALSAVVTSKGQLVIPAPIRKRFGIRKGTVVSFREKGGHLIVQPVTPQFIEGLRGTLKGDPSSLRYMFEERKRDRIL